MSEEQVTRAVLSWLAAHGWEVLDYDFPGGGTGRSFHVGGLSGKTAGIVIPDVIAWKRSWVLVMENKARDTKSDYDKIRRLSDGADFLRLLREAYPSRPIDRMIWGVAFSGSPRYQTLAKSAGIGLVLQVNDDRTCQVVCADAFSEKPLQVETPQAEVQNPSQDEGASANL